MQQQAKMNADENHIVVYQPYETVRPDVRLEKRSHVALNLLMSFWLLACGCVAPKPEDCVGQGPDWVVAT